jgi:hypothetical protein
MDFASDGTTIARTSSGSADLESITENPFPAAGTQALSSDVNVSSQWLNVDPPHFFK